MNIARAFVAVLVTTVATMLAVEIVRLLRERYAVDAEVRARDAINTLLAQRTLNAQLRKELNQLAFDLYLIENGLD